MNAKDIYYKMLQVMYKAGDIPKNILNTPIKVVVVSPTSRYYKMHNNSKYVAMSVSKDGDDYTDFTP